MTARVLSGMTASPADFGTVFAQGRGEGASAGGSTGKDIGGGYMIEEEAAKTRSTVTRGPREVVKTMASWPSRSTRRCVTTTSL